jgi:hypothetical protein
MTKLVIRIITIRIRMSHYIHGLVHSKFFVMSLCAGEQVTKKAHEKKEQEFQTNSCNAGEQDEKEERKRRNF